MVTEDRVLCCMCFGVFAVADLQPVEGESGRHWDVCVSCWERDQPLSRSSHQYLRALTPENVMAAPEIEYVSSRAALRDYLLAHPGTRADVCSCGTVHLDPPPWVEEE